MAGRKQTSRKHGTRSVSGRTKPEPGFERPASPKATNYEHAGRPGSFASMPGVGKVARERTEERTADDSSRKGKSTGRKARAASASGVNRAMSATDARDGAPLNVPSDSVGPQPSAPDVPELYDPNYTAASQRPRRATRHDLGPDARVSDAMSRDVEYCEPDTDLRAIAEKMADRDVGALPVVENMNSMRPLGIITDRDIVVRALAKGQDPYALRADQVMSIDPATIDADAPLREAIQMMERRQIRRLMVVDRQRRLRGMLAQADIAEATTRMQSGGMLQQISEPTSPSSQPRYH